MNSASSGTRLSTETDSYRTIAIVLHWLIAILILAELGIGWFMNEAMVDHSPPQEAMQDFHVSLGLTTMLLILVRIGVRLTHRPPALPWDMPGWERGLAHAIHILFYVLMIALPLTGWALLSTRRGTMLFWGLPWPHLPGLHPPAPGASRALSGAFKQIHNEWLLWITLGAVVLHVAGALKHQFDGHPVLWRMAPMFKRGDAK